MSSRSGSHSATCLDALAITRKKEVGVAAANIVSTAMRPSFSPFARGRERTGKSRIEDYGTGRGRGMFCECHDGREHRGAFNALPRAIVRDLPELYAASVRA